MGQYHLTVNLDKREFLDPHKLGDGLKLLEQAWSGQGILAATHMLLAVSNGRGGGDYTTGTTYERVSGENGWSTEEVVENEELARLSREFIGRWGGDRIAIVGDYAVDGDLPDEPNAKTLYARCREQETDEGEIIPPEFRDISDEIIPLIEYTHSIKLTGEGWRMRVSTLEEETA
jgi:hypothetical protein